MKALYNIKRNPWCHNYYVFTYNKHAVLKKQNPLTDYHYLIPRGTIEIKIYNANVRAKPVCNVLKY